MLVDNVRSSFNVGSILRSADGAGLVHVYLCGITPTPENTKVAKTALGAENSVRWSYHRNSLDLVRSLQQADYAIWALEEHAAALPLFHAPLPSRPLLLLIGNEITGVDPGLLACRGADCCPYPCAGQNDPSTSPPPLARAAVILSERWHIDQRPIKND